MPYYPFAPENDAIYRLVRGTNVAVFNDPSDPDFVGMLMEVTGLDSAEIREAADDLTQADGGLHGDFYYGRRPIVFNGKSYGHSTVAMRNARLDKLERASAALRSDATLTWKPSTRNENLILNPRAVVDTANWYTSLASSPINSGATLTRQTGLAPPVGTTGFQIATTGSGNANQGAATSINLIAGKTYAISFAYRRTAGTGSGEVAITSLSGGVGAVLATALTATGWTVVSGTFTPTVSGSHSVGFRHPASNSNASTFQFSDVMVAPGTSVTYRDGDTAGWHWQGTPGASASGDFIEMMTTVRRNQPIRYTGPWVKDFQIAMVSEYAPLFSAQQIVRSGLAGSTDGATQHVIENRGSGKSFPIIRIFGVGTDPYVENMTTGEIVRTTGVTLSGTGNYIEIDTLNHTAVQDGAAANHKINFATSSAVWPSLVMGNNTLRLVNGGSMTVTYRDTWQNGS